MVPMAEAITAVVEAAITAAALAAGEATETATAVAEMGIVAAMEVGTAEEDANESRPDLHAPCNAWPDGSWARNIGML